MPIKPKVQQGGQRSAKSTRPRPVLPRPELTPDEIALLTSRFAAGRWDATSDADRAAEEAASRHVALPNEQPKKRTARS
jgi:hypothetical protein